MSQRLTTTQWLICAIAAIGFAFDIYELLMLPLIIKPAIAALSAPIVDELVRGGMPRPDAMALWVPGGPRYVEWARTLFFMPAIAGGVFGLLGGYLTDRLGRRRVLTFSILLYAFAACAAGFATTLPQLLFFRCLVFIGVCVEFVAAVAWLAELFPDHKQRERVLGYTQAFSSFGGLLVATRQRHGRAAGRQPAGHSRRARGVALHADLRHHPGHPADPHPAAAARVAGVGAQAEGRTAEAAQHRGALQPGAGPHDHRHDAGLCGQLRHRVWRDPAAAADPGRAQSRTRGGARRVRAAREQAVAAAQAAGQPAPPEPRLRQIAGNASDQAVARVSFWQEMGGLAGRFVLAMLAVAIVSRRTLLRIFQIPALIFVPLFFWWVAGTLGDASTLPWIKVGIFVAGFLTVAQFSFWGNYIPMVFPLHLRGTGESFAANIGGRVIGTAAAWLTITLSESRPPDPAKMAVVGAMVAGVYALVGTVLTQWLPEPKGTVD